MNDIDFLLLIGEMQSRQSENYFFQKEKACVFTDRETKNKKLLREIFFRKDFVKFIAQSVSYPGTV